MQIRQTVCAVLTAAAVVALPLAVWAQERFVTIERFVPHTSTVPANAGERVGIYLREKATSAAAARFASGESPAGRVVLFVHGGSVSSIPDHDLDYTDYSWMGYLAEAGFDTCAVDPGIPEVIWRTILAFDSLGSVWGPPEGVMRVRAGNPSWGWNKAYAAKVTAPTMIVVGEQDNPHSRGVLHTDLTGTDSKVLITMACATHSAVWEASQYKFIHRASLEWLSEGTYRGRSNGAETSGGQ